MLPTSGSFRPEEEKNSSRVVFTSEKSFFLGLVAWRLIEFEFLQFFYLFFFNSIYLN